MKKVDYKKFEKILMKELPINRKEKFYTATILPAFLFHNGLSNFYHFLKKIKNFPTEIKEINTSGNFLFYTEYNLKQSAGNKSVGIEIETDTGETPDVLIEILKPKKIFLVIEAKMFQNLSQTEFDQQMKSQRSAIIKKLQKKFHLEDDQIFHIGLVPKKLGFRSTLDYQIINWEIFINDPDFTLDENYFLNYLCFALKHYSNLVADKRREPSTVKGKMKGWELYKRTSENEIIWIGREGGKRIIEKDIKRNDWKNRSYYWNKEKPAKGKTGNWITNYEFKAIIDKFEKVV